MNRPFHLLGGLILAAHLGAKTEPVQFNRDIRPILADKCYACHGPDEKQRKAKLRLDTHEGLFAERVPATLVPGQPGQSELHRRILHADPDEQMPPPHTKKHLDEKEKALLKRWISEGAKWEDHWAWTPPVKPPLPDLPGQFPMYLPIDQFLFQQILDAGIEPAPRADPRTLVRRLHLDLLGLPPKPATVEAFAKNPSDKAYATLVDQLLDSPHFGERLAIPWLDLVRYADSVGYHKDRLRECWMYRDYVIDAFNRNKPYDQFIIEQLAGDLLETPADNPHIYKVASGFNRLIQTTSEGGAQAKEYTAKYAADRVRNTASIFLGSTLGCAECHDHKYDPFTTQDFYAFAAFFADIKERGVGYPTHTPIPTPSILQKQTALKHQLTRATDKAEQERLQQELKKLSDSKTWPKTLITERDKPRMVRILPRGNWLDDSGPAMEPAVPAFLGQLDNGDARATRLDLARWIASSQNPLTARVFVNRIWKLLFGQGLSRNLDDLGAQGQWPTHPELLDWLAVDFVDNGWDIKRLIRQIVLTDAYRRSSIHPTDGELFEKQATFRLEAELVRDNALAISGLLTRKLGGRSVKPYQPANYWFRLYNTGRYNQDKGEELYRRGVYTLWRRSFWHPSLQAFDAPSREECVAHRPISNTPLQALVLLNDPTYVEAARKFAERLLDLPAGNDAQRLRAAYAHALARQPQPEESTLLLDLLRRHRAKYAGQPDHAKALLTNGESRPSTEHDPVELAAWTSLARTLLNLHETITRN